jgi:ketosteroid isomerase-like protein
MRAGPFIRTGVAIAAAFFASSRPAHGQRSATDSVRALNGGWAQAYATHDTTFANALFSHDFVVTSSGGAVRNKAGEMADVRPAPHLRMHFFRTSDVEIRPHGAATVVTGLAEWEFTFNGRVTPLRRRYTAVFVRGGSLGWQMVALHIGPAPAA